MSIIIFPLQILHCNIQKPVANFTLQYSDTYCEFYMAMFRYLLQILHCNIQIIAANFALTMFRYLVQIVHDNAQIAVAKYTWHCSDTCCTGLLRTSHSWLLWILNLCRSAIFSLFFKFSIFIIFMLFICHFAKIITFHNFLLMHTFLFYLQAFSFHPLFLCIYSVIVYTFLHIKTYFLTI
jgi:hypothetical protein